MIFTLYDELKKMSEKDPELDTWYTYIPNMPLENMEIIFALCWHHASLDVTQRVVYPPGTGKKLTIPYKGKLFDAGKGLLFNVKEIPTDLQRILAWYVKQLII
jgi:hypothetical protein